MYPYQGHTKNPQQINISHSDHSIRRHTRTFHISHKSWENEAWGGVRRCVVWNHYKFYPSHRWRCFDTSAILNTYATRATDLYQFLAGGNFLGRKIFASCRAIVFFLFPSNSYCRRDSIYAMFSLSWRTRSRFITFFFLLQHILFCAEKKRWAVLCMLV